MELDPFRLMDLPGEIRQHICVMLVFHGEDAHLATYRVVSKGSSRVKQVIPDYST
jgi:hypothetical protein